MILATPETDPFNCAGGRGEGGKRPIQYLSDSDLGSPPGALSDPNYVRVVAANDDIDRVGR